MIISHKLDFLKVLHNLHTEKAQHTVYSYSNVLLQCAIYRFYIGLQVNLLSCHDAHRLLPQKD